MGDEVWGALPIDFFPPYILATPHASAAGVIEKEFVEIRST